MWDQFFIFEDVWVVSQVFSGGGRFHTRDPWGSEYTWPKSPGCLMSVNTVCVCTGLGRSEPGWKGGFGWTMVQVSWGSSSSGGKRGFVATGRLLVRSSRCPLSKTPPDPNCSWRVGCYLAWLAPPSVCEWVNVRQWVSYDVADKVGRPARGSFWIMSPKYR